MERVRVVKTARITVETDTVMIVRQATTSRGWCPVCCAEADVVTLGQDSAADPSATTQIEEWVRTGQLHVWHQPDGPTQLCLASLLHCFELDAVPKFRIAKETT